MRYLHSRFCVSLSAIYDIFLFKDIFLFGHFRGMKNQIDMSRRFTIYIYTTLHIAFPAIGVALMLLQMNQITFYRRTYTFAQSTNGSDL